MPRRSAPSAPQILLSNLRALLEDFEQKLKEDVALREKVLALVPVTYTLRDLGGSLIPLELASGASERILLYFQTYPRFVIDQNEVIVVSGIGEWARRVRELRVELGWKIYSGTTIRQMIEAEELEANLDGQDLSSMQSDDYILLDPEQDIEAAYRWNVAHRIREKKVGVKKKILEYFQANVGKRIAGEELRYLASSASEWARRVRELRTEEGWPIFTRQTGRPDLKIGEYVLEINRQSYVHDRRIPDDVRLEVLRRDHHHCTNCRWGQEEWSSAAPRILELHHIQEHAKGGKNEADNLITLCNVCHDKLHAQSEP